MAFFSEDFNQFFIELAANNHKDWFDLNRKRYEKNIKDTFKSFVGHMIKELSSINPKFKDLEPKDCIFRINRDIRFSKDKTPYKLRLSAVIAPGGKKDYMGEGMYFEFGPEHVRFYSGVYQLDKASLLKIREAIAANPFEFKKLYSDPAFETMYGTIRGEQNKIVPKEFKSAAEIEPLLYNKQFYYFAEHEPSLILDDQLDAKLVEAYKVAKPIEEYFTKILNR
jgi:uncharacterized protein (TIGR02453 family)